MRVIEQGVIEVRAVRTVPGVVTVDPGQFAGERGEEVKQSPSDDDIVVESHIQRDQDDGEAHT